jgi:hypothetical protein
LLKINLDFLLRKAGASLNFKIDLDLCKSAQELASKLSLAQNDYLADMFIP